MTGDYQPRFTLQDRRRAGTAALEWSAEAGLSPLLHPVVDRPDRRITMAERARGYLARPRFRGSLLRAGLRLGRETLVAAARDLGERLRAQPTILSVREGRHAAGSLDAARAAMLYVHYAATAAVSPMVLLQLQQYRSLGFAIVFVSMAPDLPEAALDRLGRICALVVHRRNVGLDFGAWHDLVPIVQARLPQLDELLLANDSVCGPLRPMTPVFQVLRAAGPGLFGLTENLAPRAHLQSYFLLARGTAAVGDLQTFLGRHRPTADKRRTVRRGEVGLTRWMRERGHAVAAYCGYEAVERAALAHKAARHRVRSLFPWRFRHVPEGAPGEAAAMRLALARTPLNATHLFWRELVEDFAFPLVKTDLLLHNPLGLADPLQWRELAADPGVAAAIETHLDALDHGSPTGGPGLALATRTAVALESLRGALGRGRSADDPLVSVVLPVRDRPDALLEAVASVLAQRWRRLELIVVDDGSREDVAALLARHHADARLRVVRQEPAGVSAARNHGLREASGDIIAYLDSDNLWAPGFLDGMMRVFRRDPARQCAYGIMLSCFHGRANAMVWDRFDRQRLERSNFIDLNVFVHRRGLYDRLGGFDERLRRLVDWDLILRYTAEALPARVAVWGATYRVLDDRRISDTVPLGRNRARVALKLAVATCGLNER